MKYIIPIRLDKFYTKLTKSGVIKYSVNSSVFWNQCNLYTYVRTLYLFPKKNFKNFVYKTR